MAKKDMEGNLITKPEALKTLYIQTYVERLKHRDMKEEFKEIFQLKTVLWSERMKSIKKIKSRPWTIADIEKVTKTLKNKQTRDPNGMINELVKPNIMGKDLKNAILNLMNGIKEHFYFPDYFQLANISSIFKSKGSRFSIESERGIFILPLVKNYLIN